MAYIGSVNPLMWSPEIVKKNDKKISYSSNGTHGGAGRSFGTNEIVNDITRPGTSANKLVASLSSGKSSSSIPSVANDDYSAGISDYLSGYAGGSGGTGGYYTLDISGMLNAYEQQAAADRAVAQQAYNTKREDLLTSLKRFQEQNAKDVQNQQRAYLSNQASLESAIAQADRQNRISAAARGLGGSGLQQLAQLQNLLSQGQTISDMATQNQGVMDNLRTLLANYEADTKTAEERALADYTNTLNSINAQLATNKANAEVARANSYVAPSGGSGLSAFELSEYGKSLEGQISNIVLDYQTAKGKGSTTYKESLKALNALDLGQNSSLYKQAKNNLISIYKSKHNGESPSY